LAAFVSASAINTSMAVMKQTDPVHPLQRRIRLGGKVNDEEDRTDDAAQQDEGLHAKVTPECGQGRISRPSAVQ
jgi:hypothetical protein